jgi:hypothetical protein
MVVAFAGSPQWRPPYRPTSLPLQRPCHSAPSPPAPPAAWASQHSAHGPTPSASTCHKATYPDLAVAPPYRSPHANVRKRTGHEWTYLLLAWFEPTEMSLRGLLASAGRVRGRCGMAGPRLDARAAAQIFEGRADVPEQVLGHHVAVNAQASRPQLFEDLAKLGADGHAGVPLGERGDGTAGAAVPLRPAGAAVGPPVVRFSRLPTPSNRPSASKAKRSQTRSASLS